MTAESTLSIRGLGKAFSGVAVLDGVSLDLHGGEIVGVTGENGAGKSTLAKIIAGIHHPSAGQILMDGVPVHFDGPRDAMAQGIALIHQEPQTFPDLSIAENIFVASHPTRRGAVDWQTINRRSAEALATLDPRLRATGSASNLTVADRQLVEVAAALVHDARVLIFDETTASLTPKEVDELFRLMRRMRDEGRTVVFVTHRLEELFSIADRVVVLRDGRLVLERPTTTSSIDEVVRAMVGRDVDLSRGQTTSMGGKAVVSVRHLNVPPIVSDVTFDVREGEIVCLVGLVGSGRSEVAEALYGARSHSGDVTLEGVRFDPKSPREALARGVVLVPEDRQGHGLLLSASVSDNVSLPILSRLSRVWQRPSRERAIASGWIERLSIDSRGPDQPVSDLSGGNQQKVVIAKSLETQPRLLIVDEPTRGVDVGAKSQVHRLLRELAAEGYGILMISSDLPEALSLGDRLLVMREGRIVRELNGESATAEEVMFAAAGEGISESQPVARVRRGNPLAHREVRGLLLFVAVFLTAALAEPRFLQPPALTSILLATPLLLAGAVGQTFVVASRGIDVSVGSSLGLCAMVVGLVFKAAPHLPVWVGVVLGPILGLLLGLINGSLVSWVRIPPIVATLGTLTAFRGLIFVVCGGNQVDSNYIPEGLTKLSIEGPLSIAGVTVPWVVLAAIGCALAGSWIARMTRFGRNVFALGSNPDAAAVRGVPIARTAMGAYACCGAMAGCAGVLYLSRFGFANPATVGLGMELPIIAATVIGGCDVRGGSGSIAGVALGCLLLATISVALAVTGIAADWQLLVYGLTILAALAFEATLGRRGTPA